MSLFDQQSVFQLRPFQNESRDLAQRIKAGDPRRRAIVLATPGSGKSAIPVIFAAELIPTVVDALCWVVPRKSLQRQAEETFGKENLRRLLGHRLEIRQSTNEPMPSRGKAGYVTTMQALACDTLGLNLAEFRTKRYALVIDEAHHIWVGSASERAIRPLVEAAAFVLFMTGSGSRHDSRKMSFLPYALTCEGELLAVREPRHEWPVVRCTRRNALADRSIIRVQFYLGDGKAEWTDRAGLPQTIDSFNEADEDKLSEALHTALNTSYAYQLLDASLSHWSDWRKKVNPCARLLVVAASIAAAKCYTTYIERGGYRVEVATNDESEALANIEKFKKGETDILVTVAMAYEGLDVPPITHIACLTHIRSYPWIEQMVGRATRFDPDAGDWESQYAFVYAPDDPLMQEILRKINVEQIEAARHLNPEPEPESTGGSGGQGGGGALPEIVPHDSGMHSPRITGLDGECIPPEWMSRIADAKREVGLAASDLQLYQFLRRVQVDEPRPNEVGTGIPFYVLPSDREKKLRTGIQKRCNVLDIVRKVDPGTTNRDIMDRFGKSRTAMSEQELGSVWAWLNTHYGEQQQ